MKKIVGKEQVEKSAAKQRVSPGFSPAGEKAAVIDATDCVLGRLASQVAKRLLKGERIEIVNAEKAQISGRWEIVFQKYKTKMDVTTKINPHRSPKYSRMPDKIVRRAVRGMVPRRRRTGRDAFKKLRVYIGVPDELKGKQFESIEVAKKQFDRAPVKIEEISRALGVKL